MSQRGMFRACYSICCPSHVHTGGDRWTEEKRGVVVNGCWRRVQGTKYSAANGRESQRGAKKGWPKACTKSCAACVLPESVRGCCVQGKATTSPQNALSRSCAPQHAGMCIKSSANESPHHQYFKSLTFVLQPSDRSECAAHMCCAPSG
jgi:hypothetical protein